MSEVMDGEKKHVNNVYNFEIGKILLLIADVFGVKCLMKYEKKSVERLLTVFGNRGLLCRCTLIHFYVMSQEFSTRWLHSFLVLYGFCSPRMNMKYYIRMYKSKLTKNVIESKVVEIC
jgi:hypothetical protein